MEDEVIQSIQERLKQTTAYVDEDWGQLDYYSPNFPVKWPCTLIDIGSAQYENISIDKTASPRHRQTSDTLIIITIANLKQTNTSGRAPQLQKEAAFSIWQLKEAIHALLHGWKPTAFTGAMMRQSFRRVKRDDGVQEYEVFYSLGMTNV